MKKRLISALLVILMAFTLTFAGTAATFAGILGCKKPYAGKVVVLHTNDVHGAVDGYQYVAGLKSQYETQGAEVILADAGDFSQGSVYVSTSKGASAVKLMNAVGYDVVALGNHDFDYSYNQLKINLKNAKFKVLCPNILEGDKPIYDGHVIIKKGGLKIGFFGIDTPECKTKVNPALTGGLDFLTGDDFVNCVKDEATALRNEGADVVIALAHLGVDAESTPYRSIDVFSNAAEMGVDMVLDGHSHTVITAGEGDYSDYQIQSTGTELANVGMIVIDKATKEIEKNGLVTLKDSDGNYLEGLKLNKYVKCTAQKIINQVDDEYSEVFAKSEVALNGGKVADPEKGFNNGNRDGETNNGDLITDAMLWTVNSTGGITEVDADHIVAIVNGGGIRATINIGDVTKKDINTVMPFGNTVTVVYITGEKLLESLEASTFCTPEAVGAFPQISGMDIVVNTAQKYDASKSTYPGSTYYGPKSINRVSVESVNGKAFNPTDTYAVVTSDFCASGGDTYYAFASATTKFDTGIPLDEAVMDYVKTELGGVIGQTYAEPQGRTTLVSYKLTKPAMKLSAGKSKLSASWAKVKNANGYVVQYAKSKTFKNAKSVTVKTNKTTVKKLKKGKYYVKAKAYKTVDGVKAYSAWSATKSVTVK